MLSADPVLIVVANQTVDEGSALNITDIGEFSDVVEGSGSGDAIGLDPMAFASLGSFDPLSNVTIDTGGVTPTLSWGSTTLVGTTVTADVGFGAYEIAVFAFSSFELDFGIELDATGSRHWQFFHKATLRLPARLMSVPGQLRQASTPH